MENSRPNILVILTDDHGVNTIGCYGNREIISPNLDYLARHGVRFNRAYTPCPVCSPARASFWTGTIPSWHGVHDHLNGKGHPGIGEQPTLATFLHNAGYRTGQVGKWHCHTSEFNEARPEFDTWFSQARGTSARFCEQLFWEGDEKISWNGHQAPVVTEKAVKFLRESAEDRMPFLLTVGYTDTHSPFETKPERLVSYYREHATFEDIPAERTPPCHGFSRIRLHRDNPQARDSLANYYAAVTMIDEQVGRLIDELENLEMKENTLILYMSDHGHNNGAHGLACKGNNTIPQNFIEESIRIPCIASWPGYLPEGKVVDQCIDHCDTFATVMELAQTSADDSIPRSGQNWWLLATGDDPDWREFQFCEYANARMVSDGRHKLIRRYPGPSGHFIDQFFDLQEDPRETENRLGGRSKDHRGRSKYNSLRYGGLVFCTTK